MPSAIIAAEKPNAAYATVLNGVGVEVGHEHSRLARA
jgi:hypothetical protein